MDEAVGFPSRYAQTAPDRPAIIAASTGDVLTYAALEERSCRVANHLRSLGLSVGDNVAILLENRAEYFEVLWAAMRIGLYVTPINWHLAPEEAAYIVEDCGAQVLFASSEVPDVLDRISGVASLRARVAVGGPVPGYDDYESVLAAQPSTPPTDQTEGAFMFYSSGTTGRPKGVRPSTIGTPIGAANGFAMMIEFLFGGGEDAVYLSPAPLYHAAPTGWITAMHRLGATAVIMERFDPVEVLELIQRHRVTHAQFVPTHMIRLLKLPAEQRAAYDLSSLRYVVHAAAPCPVEVKREFIDWVGPVVHEYYSGSEGLGFCAINSEEWLEHPGSVGKPLAGAAYVVGPDGAELGPREEGQIYFEPLQRFEYHGDPAKTAEVYDERGWGTYGDVGWLDEEGYLYLTDRVSNMIITGGVNVYPREVEDALVVHPAVADAAVIGVPHPDLGETVRAVVQTAPGAEAGEALGEQLIAWTRERIAHFKCPTSVVFVDELPRLPTGKLAKRLLPDWVRGTEG